jgi:hypothetical protein
MLPFTHEQFLSTFERYNAAVWPAQLVAYALGAAVVLMLLVPTPRRARLVTGVLALAWGWTGVAYHWIQFSSINPAAILFGALFLVQALLLGWSSFAGGLSHGGAGTARTWMGWALIAYAMVLYPLAGLLSGQRYEQLPMFGITPCPLTLFTFGVLLLARSRVGWHLLVIPFAWSLVGGSAAALLRIPQDWILLLSALAVLPILRQDARLRHAVA